MIENGTPSRVMKPLFERVRIHFPVEICFIKTELPCLIEITYYVTKMNNADNTVLGGKMLRNLVCYSIATELKPKCPTCTQLMSFLALRKKTWEHSVLSHNVSSIGNHEKNAHFHLRVALLIARNSASEVLLFCASSLSRKTSSLLFRPCETRFSITAPRSSILDACEF